MKDEDVRKIFTKTKSADERSSHSSKSKASEGNIRPDELRMVDPPPRRHSAQILTSTKSVAETRLSVGLLLAQLGMTIEERSSLSKSMTPPHALGEDCEPIQSNPQSTQYYT